MDLFNSKMEEKLEQAAPLALRMRPASLEEFVGQDEIVGPNTFLREAIERDTLSSAIFYGPPGSGKTTLAQIIAKKTNSFFVQLSAVSSNVSEVRKVINEAKDRLKLEGRKTILFIDEIHRFNKAQQDAFLASVEEGIVVLIGATTENPFFEVNSPLISRSKVYQFKPLSPEDIRAILKRALKDEEKGLGKLKVELQAQALDYVVKAASGDGRIALNVLEAASMLSPLIKEGKRVVGLKTVQDAACKKALVYDKSGDAHFDMASAFIKSMRGSDPQATLYWLARMIASGEDPRFIARRIVIAASEDVGLADSKALEVAVAAARAVEFVGLPEARINLAHAALYLALAPKDNSAYLGIDKALKDVEKEQAYQVPKHLRDNSYPGAKKLGHGDGYKYPHNYPGGKVSQSYLPDELEDKKYYLPSDKRKDR